MIKDYDTLKYILWKEEEKEETWYKPTNLPENRWYRLDPENIFSQATYKSTRNQGNKLRQRHCKTDIRKFSFSHRVVEKWNTLPEEIQKAPSANAFKNRMDGY